MPLAASSLEKESFIRALLMGVAKAGKTTSSVDSLVAAFGPGYVIVCGDKGSLLPAQRRTTKFEFDVVRDEADMEAVLKDARAGVKENRYKWVVVDDFSLYASWLENALRTESAGLQKSGEADGRKYWPAFKSRLLNVVRRLFDLKCHVVVISHWISPSQEIDGQRPKAGQGIMPMISGSAREELPAMFQDVLFMTKDGSRRIFQINPEGVWGPGSRSVDGTHDIDADWGAFWDLAKKGVPSPAVEKKAAGGRR